MLPFESFCPFVSIMLASESFCSLVSIVQEVDLIKDENSVLEVVNASVITLSSIFSILE